MPDLNALTQESNKFDELFVYSEDEARMNNGACTPYFKQMLIRQIMKLKLNHYSGKIWPKEAYLI